jgi:general secretion pathway protein E
MRVEDYLLTSTLAGVAAQRLVRRLCDDCRAQERALPELVEQLGLERFGAGSDALLWRAVGCEQCNGTGYRGRTTVIETLVVDDEIRRLILRRPEAKELQRAALAAGMVSMYEDGMRKALGGDTTIEEVLRVTRDV